MLCDLCRDKFELQYYNNNNNKKEEEASRMLCDILLITQPQRDHLAIALLDGGQCSMPQAYVAPEHWKVSPLLVCPQYYLEMCLNGYLHETQ